VDNDRVVVPDDLLLGEKDVALTTSMVRRLNHQIERAFRGTYGAESGLRTLVRMGTQQMLLAGAPPASIGSAFSACVLNHPCPEDGNSSVLRAREKGSRILEGLMLVWAAEVYAPRTAQRSVARAG
jgi:hypothetical protein